MRWADVTRVAYHVVPLSRLNTVMTQGLIPRIGPRSRRAKEPEHAIYLFTDGETAESCIENWLIDEFHENTKLALLRVRIPEGTNITDGYSYEFICYDPIPPENIEVLSRDVGNETSEFFSRLD